MVLRKSSRNKTKAKKVEQVAATAETEECDSVVETVGERIKNRKRNVPPVETPKYRKCTELDRLHNDIKEMFICDGVLTATGKRMCRILKSDAQPKVEEKAKQEELSNLDSPKRRARTSNPKVLIEKTDFSKLVKRKVESDSESDESETPIVTRRSSKRKTLDFDSTSDSSPTKSMPTRSLSKRTQKTKPIYTETAESDDLPSTTPSIEKEEEEEEEEKENTTEKEVPEKKIQKKKRRGHSWAIGVITKKSSKKKPSTSSEELVPEIPEETTVEEATETKPEDEPELIPHSIDYFFEPLEKSDCKLCQFKGRFIVQHYKTVHPGNEVMISRIPPENAKTAIEESIDNSFSEIEPVDMFEPSNKNRKKKFTYQCRFCQVVHKNETSENFFDHLTSHTGEYRFHCSSCQFKTSNVKALRSHVYSSHQTNCDYVGLKTAVYPPPPNFSYVFGYICGTCNFVQLEKSLLEDHIKSYHKNDTTIYKINMSTVSNKPIFQDEAEPDKPEDANVEPVLEKDTEPDVQSEAVEANAQSEEPQPEKNKEVTEPEEIRIDPQPEVIKAKQKEDPTVFDTTPDCTTESIKMEEQKHVKMQEINQNIIPKKKFSFDLLDKIKSRLDDKSEMTISNVAPTLPEATSSVKIINEVVKPVDIIKPALKPENKVSIEKAFSNKSSVPITNIIERLQGKLNMDVQPPPLIPIDVFSVPPQLAPEEIVVQVGPVAARKKNNFILYLCYMQSCMFSSTNENEFQTHCKTFHGNKQWDGICSLCNINTNLTEVEDAYSHLLNSHLNELEVEEKKPDVEVKSYLRMRRLSGDLLSEQKPDTDFDTNSEEMPFKIVNVETEDNEEEDNFNFPFQISSVTTLTPEEDQALNASTLPISTSPISINVSTPSISLVQSPISTLTVINSLATAGSVTSVSSTTTIPMTSYSFVLPVLSPIPPNSPKRPTTPILVPLSKSNVSVPIPTTFSSTRVSPSKKIVLKDVPLSAHELIAPRKTTSATFSLLSEQKLIHLYKCPESSCVFSTDVKRLFEVHLQQHPEFKPGVQINCLYCNFKTDCRLFVVHCDVRHGRCQYCCVYCFYRSINQSYVEMHQERDHPRNKKRVLKAPINSDALTSQAQITLPTIKSVVPLHICGVAGCSSNFIFPLDFASHCVTAHAGTILSCYHCLYIPTNGVDAARHMQEHNVCMYHCRYCLYGGNTLEVIHHHLSLQHFALAPRIIERKFVPDATNKPSSDYLWNDPKSFERLTILSSELPKYVTPSVLIEVVPSYVPNKKPIPIAPKNKIGNVMKASLQDKSETITLYKAPIVTYKKSPVSIKIVDQSPTKVNENKSINPEEGAQLDVAKKTGPSDLLNLTLNISKQREEEKKNEVPITSSNVSDCSISQSEAINTDAPSTETTANTTNKASEEDTSKSEQDVSESTDSTSEQTESRLDVSSNTSFTEDELSDFISDQAYDSSSSNVRKKGLSGKDLFRCSICHAPFTSSQEFKVHVNRCVKMNKDGTIRPYSCVHCFKAFKTINSLLDHIRVHGTDRFACSLCDFKQSHQFHIRSHMKARHNVNNAVIAPVNPLKNNIDEDNFVLKPKINRQKSHEGVSHKDSHSVVTEPVLRFGPEDIASVPLHPIFNKEVKCSSCGYATKVRANLMRHFQFHKTGKEVSIPATAPVNPVPCLDKNERMFDKMFNLSLSSYNDAIRIKTDRKDQPRLTKDEEAELPSFVPATKRYVCGAINCDYLCLEESMLRSHLQALHNDETFYKCTHCEEVLFQAKGAINIDQILKHLRLHDLHLYKCRYCKFLHNLKHKVERHVSDKHPNTAPLVIIVREMEHELEEMPHPQEEVKEAKPWRCGMCKYRCSTKPEIVSHVNNKHDLDTQFKCALCQYRTSTKYNFSSHFQTEHPGQNVDVIDAYYEEETIFKPIFDAGLFDTTPIWQREKNKIKHIRGIPIEESNKLPKKSPAKSDDKINDVKKTANATVKKPKTLKEKKMELIKHDELEIIEIEDDDNLLTIDEKPKGVESGVKSKVVSAFASQSDDDKKDGLEFTIDELSNMDVAILKNSQLSGMGGPFGLPHNRQFLCPKCNTFKTKKSDDFTHHLYKHLEYHRFVCTSCGLTGITYSFLKKHSARKHVGLPEAIHPMTPDPQIEEWVRKVLVVQGRIMKENENVATVSSTTALDSDKVKTDNAKAPHITKTVTEINVADSSSTLGKPKFANQCQHCSYSCRTASDLRKHERRHWVQKPLKCGYCDCEGVTNYEIQQHSKRAHPNLEPIVVTIPTPSTPTIKPIARKRKYPKNEGAITSSSDDIPTKITLIDLDDSSSTQSEDATVEIKKGTINYKCGYCPLIGPLDVIKPHCKTFHPDTLFSAYRYACKYCDKYFKNIDKVRTHYREIHKDVIATCFDISEPPTAKEYNCEYCTSEFTQQADLVNHHCTLHSHLVLILPSDRTNEQTKNVEEKKKFKCPYEQCIHFANIYSAMRDHVRTHAKPFQCAYCTTRFIYPSAAKIHLRREHPDLEVSIVTSHEGTHLYQELRNNILVLNDDGDYQKIKISSKKGRPLTFQPSKKLKLSDNIALPTARKSTTQIYVTKVKATARKSTTFIPNSPSPPPPPTSLAPPLSVDQDGYTFYGNSPDMEGVENLKAILLFNGSYLRITFDQLEKIFDVYPTVEVIDLKHNRNEL